MDDRNAERLRAQRCAATQAEITVSIAVVVRIETETIVRIGGRESSQAFTPEGDSNATFMIGLGGERYAAAAQPVAAAFGAQRERLGFAGEELDHAADCIRTPERGARTTHDLDPFDLIQRQMREIEHALVGGCDPHAVDQHQGLVGVGATQEHRARLACAASARDVHTGLLRKQTDQIGRRAAFDLGAFDQRHRGQRIIDRLCMPRRGDIDSGQVGDFARRGIGHIRLRM